MTAQPQRTDLAWTRASLSVLALVLIGARLAADGPPLGFVPVAVALAGSFGFLAVALHRTRQLRQLAVPPPVDHRLLLLVTVAVLAADVAGAYLVVT